MLLRRTGDDKNDVGPFKSQVIVLTIVKQLKRIKGVDVPEGKS